MKHNTKQDETDALAIHLPEEGLDRINWRSMTLKGDTDMIIRHPTHHEKPDHPITQPEDPRWVLALQAHSKLEGGRIGAISPENREKLVEMGKQFGLRPFDVQLVIAIVQDNARQGFESLSTDATHRLACVQRVATPSVRNCQIAVMLMASLSLGVLAAAMFVVWMTR